MADDQNSVRTAYFNAWAEHATPRYHLMLTVKEFASRLGYAPKSIRKAIKDGNLKAVRLGPRGTYLIPESELRRLLEGA